MVSTLANDADAGEAADREGRHHECGVQAEAAGVACGLATHSESDIRRELCFLLRDFTFSPFDFGPRNHEAYSWDTPLESLQ